MISSFVCIKTVAVVVVAVAVAVTTAAAANTWSCS